MAPPGISPDKRIRSLDAVRGIASVVVVLHHLRLCTQTGLPRWFLRPLFAGRASVAMFFVLSGYVLSLPVWHRTQLPYGRYLVRRFFRIYIPFLAAAVFAFAVARHLLFSHTGLTAWFGETWQTPMGFRFLLHELLTVPTEGRLNTAFWSLRYEMEMSLIFPFLCLWLRGVRTWLAVIGVAVLWKLSLTLMALRPQSSLHEPLQTIAWATCFCMGALLAREQKGAVAGYKRLGTLSKALFCLVSLVLFYNSREVMVPFGACGLLILAQDGAPRRWLETAVPQYLGRISYSLYLVHGTLLWAAMILFVHRMPFAVLTAIYLCVTLLVSHVFCIFIEEPAMSVGRWLTRPAGSRKAMPHGDRPAIAQSN